jgi:predicted nucleotidyltransferase
MRLSQKEIDAIKTNFEKFFDEGVLYLFGSRVDDTRKGGDIDLYITTQNRENLVEKKIEFSASLQREIGEQKIDIVLDYGDNRLIDKKAKDQGVVLCKMS